MIHFILNYVILNHRVTSRKATYSYLYTAKGVYIIIQFRTCYIVLLENNFHFAQLKMS